MQQNASRQPDRGSRRGRAWTPVLGILLLTLSLIGAVPATAAPAPASASAAAVAATSITDLSASARSITYGQYTVLRYNLSSGGTRLAGAQTILLLSGGIDLSLTMIATASAYVAANQSPQESTKNASP